MKRQTEKAEWLASSWSDHRRISQTKEVSPLEGIMGDSETTTRVRCFWAIHGFIERLTGSGSLYPLASSLRPSYDQAEQRPKRQSKATRHHDISRPLVACALPPVAPPPGDRCAPNEMNDQPAGLTEWGVHAKQRAQQDDQLNRQYGAGIEGSALHPLVTCNTRRVERTARGQAPFEFRWRRR